MVPFRKGRDVLINDRVWIWEGETARIRRVIPIEHEGGGVVDYEYVVNITTSLRPHVEHRFRHRELRAIA